MNLNEIKVVNRDYTYSKIVDFINLVIENCFDPKTGMFHQYKYDYAFAVALIAMYTDYDGSDYKFDEVMDFIYTDKWQAITTELGNKYKRFKYYVDEEVKQLNRPFAFAGETIFVIKNLATQLNGLIEAIDKDKLKHIDLTELSNTLEALAEKVEEKKNTSDNIVEMPK